MFLKVVSLEERVDQLTTLLMVARTDIRKLQAQFDDQSQKDNERTAKVIVLKTNRL